MDEYTNVEPESICSWQVDEFVLAGAGHPIKTVKSESG